MNILDNFERFLFSFIPCGMEEACSAISYQARIWGKNLEAHKDNTQDVRLIYLSPHGPHNRPSAYKCILLSEHNDKDTVTSFVSNVSDGYSSMVHMISKKIEGTHFSFEVSRSDLKYPKNSFVARADGRDLRVVYTMKDVDGWVHFESGNRFEFEERLFKSHLTPDLIELYLQRLGYGSLSQEFWVSENPAYLLKEPGFEIWSKCPEPEAP